MKKRVDVGALADELYSVAIGLERVAQQAKRRARAVNEALFNAALGRVGKPLSSPAKASRKRSKGAQGGKS